MHIKSYLNDLALEIGITPEKYNVETLTLPLLQSILKDVYGFKVRPVYNAFNKYWDCRVYTHNDCYNWWIPLDVIRCPYSETEEAALEYGLNEAMLLIIKNSHIK